VLRIVAGIARGRRLRVPDGQRVRPTADRVREAMFSALGSRLRGGFDDLAVLDVFGGSGALGLEAYSRGARPVTIVEAHAGVRAILRENVDGIVGGTADAGAVHVVAATAQDFLARPATSTFDLVFVDPPYDAGLCTPTLAALVAGGWIARGALVCVEHRSGSPPEVPAGLVEVQSRRYGETTVTILAAEQSMREAIYPGSFDPITNGHIDIIRRGLAIFDRIVVATAVNVRKQPLFTDEDRLDMLRQTFADEPRVEIDTFQGLLVDYARQRRIPTVLRGLRAVSDFEYEFQMASMNRRLSHDVDYLFMMTSEDQYYVSSSLIREVAANGGSVEGLVPPHVEARLKARIAAQKRP
jgi:pantetheine-phosphate adenylyltransferase